MIPVCEPLLSGNEIEYVLNCLQSNWISSQGEYIQSFEDMFAEYCGVRYGISTTSGTTALHLALVTAGIGEGDQVIIPTFTMAATAFSVAYTGAQPVLVDAEPETWNIDVNKIEQKITQHTRAIIPVHIYGHPCDMEPIMDIAQKHDLIVIEDAAEAHGAEYKGKKAGGIGHINCFSFYANKIITTGEGGMVVTDDQLLAERAKRLKDLAHSPDQRFLHTDIAYNYRMTNIQAAIGVAQLENIDCHVEARRSHAALYNKILKDVPGIVLPTEKAYVKNVYWMYGIVINNSFGINRDELMKVLFEKGIQTRAFFIPMHKQPALINRGLFKNEIYPVADKLGDTGLYLPSGSGLKEEDIYYICDTIKKIARK